MTEPRRRWRNRRHGAWAVATWAACAVVLTACSSPEPVAPETGGTTPGTDEETGENAETEAVRFFIASGLNNAPLMAAADNGYWREQGLDVTLEILDSGGQIANALISGEAEIGIGNATSSIPLSRAGGNDLTMVAPFQNNPLVVQGVERVGIIAHRSSGVVEGDAASLEGKSVGVLQGSTSESYLNSYLAANDMTQDDLNIVNLTTPDMPTALRQQNVDAIVPWEPYTSEAIRVLGDDATVLVRGGPYGRSIAGLVVTDQYLEENAEIVKKMIIGALQGAQFVRQQPDEGAAIAQRYLSGTDLQDLVSGLEQLQEEFDPRLSVCSDQAVLEAQEGMIAQGQMDVSEPYAADAILRRELLDEVLAENPELIEDLAPLPTSVDECG